MTNNIIVISDLHCGCQFGLCPSKGIRLDNGGRYLPNLIQTKVWEMWQQFWAEWVPMVTRGEPYDLAINGDTIDGKHHNSTHQISHNLNDQVNIALEILHPVVENVQRLFVIRGTEAHVGESGVKEEEIATRLGAVPNKYGQYARNELWVRVGKSLVHIMHHIGTTGSAAYESTAVHKELIEAYVESARHREEPPDVIVRSHRHRYFKTSFAASIPCVDGIRKESRDAIAVITAGWQGKTPFTYRIPGGRSSQPQFGGIIVKAGDEDPIYTRHQTWSLERPEVE